MKYLTLAVLLGFVSLAIYDSTPRTETAEQFQEHWGLHVGGLDTQAKEGERLLFHMTGDLYEMQAGQWVHLSICDE